MTILLTMNTCSIKTRGIMTPKNAKKARIKRLLLVMALLVTAFCVLHLLRHSILPQACANGASLEEIRDALGGHVNTNLHGLDMSALQDFVNELQLGEADGFFGGSVTFFMHSIINGEFHGGFGAFLNHSFRLITGQILSFLPFLISIVAISIIFSVIDGMSSGFLKSSTHEIIYFVCYAAIVVLVVTQVMRLTLMTRNTIGGLQTLMNASFPILLTLMIALGGHVSVSAYQPMLAVLSVGIVNVITALIIPAFIASTVFSVVGNLSKTVKLEKFTKFFKSFAEFVLGLVFGLFMFFVAFEGITGSILDGISIRSARFALSSYVPILGGYLSDGFDLFMASFVLIKNAVGVTSLLIMLFVILSPVITIYLFSLGLKLTAGIIEPICDKRLSELIYGVSKNITLLAVAILGVAFMFFIMVMLVIFTGNFGYI